METLKPYARKMIYDIFNKLGIFPVSNRTFINNINANIWIKSTSMAW